METLLPCRFSLALMILFISRRCYAHMHNIQKIQTTYRTSWLYFADCSISTHTAIQSLTSDCLSHFLLLNNTTLAPSSRLWLTLSTITKALKLKDRLSSEAVRFACCMLYVCLLAFWPVPLLFLTHLRRLPVTVSPWLNVCRHLKRVWLKIMVSITEFGKLFMFKAINNLAF